MTYLIGAGILFSGIVIGIAIERTAISNFVNTYSDDKKDTK